MAALVSRVLGSEPIKYCFDSCSSCSVGPSVATLVNSASMEATARATFAALTPARTISGPGTRLASSELYT